MTSKDWPEVHLFSSMTSMSEITHQFRSTVSAAERRRGAAHPLKTAWAPVKHTNMHTSVGDLGAPGKPMANVLGLSSTGHLRSMSSDGAKERVATMRAQAPSLRSQDM